MSSFYRVSIKWQQNFATRKLKISNGIGQFHKNHKIMKPSPPGRFRDLHLLLDRQKQAEQDEAPSLRLSPVDLEKARLEMERNYQHQIWKKEHKLQSFFGVRLTAMSNYGMLLVMGAVYFWIKYGSIDPFPASPPRFTVTKWLQ